MPFGGCYFLLHFADAAISSEMVEYPHVTNDAQKQVLYVACGPSNRVTLPYSNVFQLDQVQEVPAEVHGTIPSWLSGSLIMNGGGDYSSMRHLFDGYGLLSKVRLEGGKAWGSQRYIDTQAHRMYRERGE